MMTDKILVTGGSGFIGQALVARLLKNGYSVVVLDNAFRGRGESLKSLKNCTLIEGDIRKKEDVQKAAQGVSGVIHLAFINGTKYFYEQPEHVLEVGVKGALNTLEVVLESGIKKYVLASSSEVYQEPTHVPTTEKERIFIPDVTNPRFSYAGGKIISEILTLNYLRKSNIQHMIFRPHNVFGPNMGLEHVIPELMVKLHEATRGWQDKSCQLSIQGSGEESRAFCFVEDAVDQITVVLEKGKTGEIYHIGMDEQKKIKELIADIAQALGITINIRVGQLRAGSTPQRCPSIEKVKALGYTKKNNYGVGLQKTVDWYKNFLLNANPSIV